MPPFPTPPFSHSGTGDVSPFLLTWDAHALARISIGPALEKDNLLHLLEKTVADLKVPGGAAVVKPGPQVVLPRAAADALVLHLTARKLIGPSGWNEFPSEDWVLLSRGQYTKLLPAGAVKTGTTWDPDPQVAAQILTHFFPQTETTTPNEDVLLSPSGAHKHRIEQQALKATVLSIQNGVVRARLDGSLRLHHLCSLRSKEDANAVVTAELLGLLEFDAERKQIRSLRLVTHGAKYGNTPIGVAVRSIADGVEVKPAADDWVLFDFEDPAELAAWSNLELPDAKVKEPAARFERSTEHATSGRHSLKITFAGGRWPTLTTTHVPEDWTALQTFHADVTVNRPCLVGFTVLQEKSRRGGGWDDTVSRWVKTALLRPGQNAVSAPLHPPNDYALSQRYGKVVRFEIFLYAPHDGESIYVDNIRLSPVKEVVPPVQTFGDILFLDVLAVVSEPKDRFALVVIPHGSLATFALSYTMTPMPLNLHPDSERLARAIDRCLPLAVPWAGDLFRATDMEFATPRDLASGDGARQHGGRWTPKGSFHTMYGSLTVEGALAEILEGHRRKGVPDVKALPVALVGLRVSLQRTLDLTDGRVRRTLGLSRERVTSEPWEQLPRRGREAITQAVGRLAHAAGFEGLLVPSAVSGSKDRNLVVFPGQLLSGSRLEIVHAEQLAARRRKKA